MKMNDNRAEIGNNPKHTVAGMPVRSECIPGGAEAAVRPLRIDTTMSAADSVRLAFVYVLKYKRQQINQLQNNHYYL